MKMKKTVTVLLSVVLMVACALSVSACAKRSGSKEDAGTQGLNYTLNSDGQSYSVTGIGVALSKDIVIPSEYNSKPVTGIAKAAFKYGKITSVKLPDTLESIGEEAFASCESLKSVNFPTTLTSIGEKAFIYCSSLKSVTLPSSITRIENNTFQSCTGLESITIPSSVTFIGAYVFYNCRSLKSIEIPSSVSILGPFAFTMCTGLSSVEIPSSITVIETQTFNGCTNLVSITLPDALESIGTSAFGFCSSLTDINYGGTKEQWNDVEKMYGWNSDTGSYTVHCKGEDVSK